MWSNRRYLDFFSLVFQTEAMSVTGTEGGSVKITCSHSYATTNVKYFCKGACSEADVLTKSRPMRQEGKYSIEDKGNTFYVTISKLEKGDEGVYWCGVERVGVDTYDKVTLSKMCSYEFIIAELVLRWLCLFQIRWCILEQVLVWRCWLWRPSCCRSSDSEEETSARLKVQTAETHLLGCTKHTGQRETCP
uniref:Ig-like domain-containing protein n=1 Tax=Poecilia latipinna TaxID=48699 RepID=A0A3B3TLZ7_9TELE